MKITALVFTAIIILFAMPICAFADDEDDALDATDDFITQFGKTIDGLDLEELERSVDNLPDLSKIIGQDLSDAITRASKGELSLNAWEIIQILFNSFINEIGKNSALLLKILVLAVLMAVLGALQPAFMSEGVSNAAGFATYMLVVALLAQSLIDVVGIGSEAINSMSGITESAFPIMLTLMTAMGGSVSAGIFKPAMAVLTGSVCSFFTSVILPMVLVAAMLTILQHVSNKIQIKQTMALLIKITQWLIGAVFVVYIGVTALQGLAGASYDGIALRTAKFAIDKFVPIIGGMFSDTVDTIIGCSLVVKNGVGIIGLVMIAGAMLSPVLHILAISLLYKLAAALIEPFGEKRLPECLVDISKVYTMLYISVLAVGAMMFILVSMFIAAGNINIMMR